MKKISILLLTIPGFYFAQLASGIAIHDTRSTNNSPSEYRHQIQGDFKYRSTVGVPGEGLYSGMLTIAPWGDNSGDKHHQLNFNNGGIFYRTGLPEGQWEDWKQLLTTNSNGNVGIGTKSPATNLEVSGIIRASSSNDEGGSIDIYNSSKTGTNVNTWRIYNMTGGYGNSLQFWAYSADQSIYGPRLKLGDNGDIAMYGKLEAKEIKVTTTPTADFVFEDSYQLPNLESVEKHIKEKKHLPEIASASEMQKEGVNIGDFQIKLLQKIEELTLYQIQLNKEVTNLKQENIQLKETLQKIQNHEKSY
ncbi:cell wall anchor protein [Elizabethkingia anophelis]|nr:cell wall anchor protein [Elizabethkingia anophelis]